MKNDQLFLRHSGGTGLVPMRRYILSFCLIAAAGVLFPLPVLAGENELTLDQARDHFLRHNGDILIHEQDVQKAEADVRGATLLPNPAVSINYAGLDKGTLRAGDNAQQTYRIDQLIELGGKRGFRIDSARENLEAARQLHRDVIRTVLAGFYTLYFNLSLDALNIAVAREQLAQFDKTLEIAGKRHSAGFLSFVDYTKLRIARIDLENGLATVENQFKNDSEQIRVLLGSSAGVRPAPGQLREDLPRYQEDELIARAEKHRSDLLALQHQLRSSQHAVSLAKAGVVPDVTLGAEYERFGPTRDPGVGFGISFNIPLFDRNQGEIGKRKAEQRQVELQIAKQKMQIESDIRQALHNYETSLKVSSLYQQKKAEVETLLANSEKAFALGGITALDLLDTRKTYNEFMAKYNQALVQSNLTNELINVYTGELPWIK